MMQDVHFKLLLVMHLERAAVESVPFLTDSLANVLAVCINTT